MYNCYSTQPFGEETCGLAIPDSMCTERAVTVLHADEQTDEGQIESLQTSINLAQMIAHTLGVRQDANRK